MRILVIVAYIVLLKTKADEIKKFRFRVESFQSDVVASRSDSVEIINNNSTLTFANANSEIQSIGEVDAAYTQNIEGWNDLTLSVSSEFELESDSFDQFLAVMRASGIAEGYLCCTELIQSYENFYADNFGDSFPPDDVVSFIIDNFIWINGQSRAYPKDSYWLTVRGAVESLLGVIQGFWLSSCVTHSSTPVNAQNIIQTLQSMPIEELKPQPHRFSLLHLLMMNAWGDLYTIMTKYALENLDREGRTGEWVKDGLLSHRTFYPHTEYIERDLRCSSLFKLLPDYADVMFGHATWGSFIALGPRTFKHTSLPTIAFVSAANDKKYIYKFSVRSNHFSSSPGLLSSLDDFYVIYSEEPPTKLAVIETTNDVMNPDLFEFVTPASCLCWLRVLLANSLATDGHEWTTVFARYHSGTYTNQWQVADLTKFTPGEAPEKGFFYLLEEIPGTIVSRDMTDHLLSTSYWASYNIPYYKSISSVSGYRESCKLHQLLRNDSSTCWDSAPRANIFRERQSELTSIEEFKQLINYNDWQNDPLSLSDPCNAISCRRDLEPEVRNRYPSGGMDAKVSSFTLMENFFVKNRDVKSANNASLVYARMGPTNDQQTSFCWSNLTKKYVHEGQPDCFDFKWVTLP